MHLDWTWPSGSGVKAALAQVGSPKGTRIGVVSTDTSAHADVPFSTGTQLIASFTNPSLTANSVPVTLKANTVSSSSSSGGGGTSTTTTTPTTTTPVPPPEPPRAVAPTIQVTRKPRVTKTRTARVLTFSVNSSATGFVNVTLVKAGAKLAAHTAAKASTFSRTLALKAAANAYRIGISKKVPTGSFTISLTPLSTASETGLPISAGRVRVPTAPKVKKKAKRAGPTRVY